MRTAEFLARASELDRCAPHMSPAVALSRLVELVGEYAAESQGAADFRGLREATSEIEWRMAEAQKTPKAAPSAKLVEQSPVSFAEPDLLVYRAWGQIADRIANADEAWSGFMETKEREDPEPEPIREALPEPKIEVIEPTKPCKRCGPVVGPKPLSAFGKDVRTADGHGQTCSACLSESTRRAALAREQTQREAEASPGASPAEQAIQEPEPEPEKPSKKAEKTKREQLCGNGEDCVGFAHMKRPTKLHSRNKTGVCMACEDRDRDAGLSGRVGQRSSVRKSKDRI